MVLISADNKPNITYGIPQESLSEPLLSLIYTYDMGQAVLLEHSCMLIIRFQFENAQEI